ncbi:hypothetical protein [Bifidobacterium scardovii]|mgnify:CR=1 FL=1|uniref:Uncharacterized protein n=1 Tax=Bifidobacterium scardovii TaxID=158787 RepID=A0A087DGR6_9BIFI|nr:hypothetical protein [Bifidobacterium scardovii]DAE55525.1 MAG TPA: hypothetical protein [Caudoviricetes sp.]KFI94716.1 hypothetical protein BSCA_0768 [Bifidobacterium scardovii]MDK6349850.1 hypothetical protein [Bifidobacterium scardovii]MDU8982554.1 hypothetical protein [Bifidobacterium scardovii]BAQ32062.1 hypothetical protein BBSC_1982 [Bifidobacterium scardovii JCM 12489 = DSM 13734]
MIRTYRLDGSDQKRAHALIHVLGIDMDRVKSLDEHPMIVRVSDNGRCLVHYSGVVACDMEDIAFCLQGLSPVAVEPGSIETGSGNAGTGFFARIRECLSTVMTRPSKRRSWRTHAA